MLVIAMLVTLLTLRTCPGQRGPHISDGPRLECVDALFLWDRRTLAALVGGTAGASAAPGASRSAARLSIRPILPPTIPRPARPDVSLIRCPVVHVPTRLATLPVDIRQAVLQANRSPTLTKYTKGVRIEPWRQHLHRAAQNCGQSRAVIGSGHDRVAA